MRIEGLAAGMGRLGRICGFGAVALGLAGCTMGGMFGGSDSSQYVNTSATQAEIAQAAPNALPAIATECPPIKVLPSAGIIQNYGGGKQGNPDSLHYQVTIEKQTRSCIVSNGLITTKIGVLGRVLLGPAGNEHQVDVPLRVIVDRDNATVFSEKYVLPVAITPPAQSSDFVKVVDNVQIPYLGGENITIWVGFDSKR